MQGGWDPCRERGVQVQSEDCEDMESGHRQFFQKCLVVVIVGGLLLLEQFVEVVPGIGKGRSLEARH